MTTGNWKLLPAIGCLILFVEINIYIASPNILQRLKLLYTIFLTIFTPNSRPSATTLNHEKPCQISLFQPVNTALKTFVALWGKAI